MKSNLRVEVYEFLRSRGLQGATDLEIQEGLNMNPSTERPRRGELVKMGLVHDSGEQRLTDSKSKAVVWHAVRAQSRAEGIENVKAVEGIRFYVIADAYRAAREEAEEEARQWQIAEHGKASADDVDFHGTNWPYGSDAAWADEAGVAQPQVAVLSRLYGADEDINAFISWSEAREAVRNLPPVDGRSTKMTATNEAGEEIEGDVLPPEDAQDNLSEDEWIEEPLNKKDNKRYVDFEKVFLLIVGSCNGLPDSLPPISTSKRKEMAKELRDARKQITRTINVLDGG